MLTRFRSRYRAGDWVRIRSKEEILASLDARGALDKLPFMPEMLAFCGQRFQVAASAHKTCDTVQRSGGRRMRAAVHLGDLRCDGAAHAGCQARCLFFWKEQWLAPAEAPVAPAERGRPRASPACTEADLQRATRTDDDPQSPTYSCQATRLFEATTRLRSWTPRQYAADVCSRNVSLGDALKYLGLAAVYSLRRIGIGYRFWCAVYERAHRLVLHSPSPYAQGAIARGTPTPSGTLDLQPGEEVVVKPHSEILLTLNERNRNRGLSFDKEMVRYCGQRFRVAARMERIINETTGKMMKLPAPSVTLEGTYCSSHYSERRMLCPRRILPYWRELWLQRTGEVPPQSTPARTPHT